MHRNLIYISSARRPAYPPPAHEVYKSSILNLENKNSAYMTYATETGGAVCNNGYHIMSINVEIIDTIKVAYNYSSFVLIRFVGLHCVSKNVHLFIF